MILGVVAMLPSTCFPCPFLVLFYSKTCALQGWPRALVPDRQAPSFSKEKSCVIPGAWGLLERTAGMSALEKVAGVLRHHPSATSYLTPDPAALHSPIRYFLPLYCLGNVLEEGSYVSLPFFFVFIF